MTVVAYDGDILAVDSRMTCGTTITSNNFNKLYRLGGVSYFEDRLLVAAFAGTIVDIHKFLSALFDPDYPNNTIQHRLGAIIIGERYVYEIEEDTMYMIQHNKKEKLSIGSGGDVALSAMHLGLDAIQAVKHAIKINSACGGRVRSWRRKVNE